MTHVFKIFTVLFSLLIVIESANAQQVPLNIAIVDFEKILRTASSMQGIRDQIQSRRDAYRNEVQKEETDLRQANQELLQKRTLLTPEAFQAERQKFQDSIQNAQRGIQQKNQSLQLAQSQAQQIVNDEVRKIIIELSQKRGYTLVLRNAQAVIVADAFNITDEVISELNKRLPSVKVF